MNSPTAEQADNFHRYVLHWQKLLNLNSWRIEKSKKKAPRDAMACVVIDSDARLAAYRLGDFGSAEITERTLSETALHEVLHVFLYDLKHSSNDEAIEHEVINVLEKLLMEL